MVKKEPGEPLYGAPEALNKYLLVVVIDVSALVRITSLPLHLRKVITQVLSLLYLDDRSGRLIGGPELRLKKAAALGLLKINFTNHF